jgi:hypothetical protein
MTWYLYKLIPPRPDFGSNGATPGEDDPAVKAGVLLCESHASRNLSGGPLPF